MEGDGVKVAWGGISEGGGIYRGVEGKIENTGEGKEKYRCG